MKKIFSIITCVIMVLALSVALFADDITSDSEFSAALRNGGEYVLTLDVKAVNHGINSSVTIDGNGHSIIATNADGGASIYSNDGATVTIKNVSVSGNEKGDVGFWIGSGVFTLEDATVTGYTINDGRCVAITSGFGGHAVLNNVKFKDNTVYDVCINGATVTINEGTELTSLWLQDGTAVLNIGDNWSGSFVITLADAKEMTLGTVGTGTDVSGITVSNEGYYVAADNGNLIITTSAPVADDTNAETPADDTAAEVPADETTENTDTDEETTPAETGMALAIIPMAVAAAAIAVSKKR